MLWKKALACTMLTLELDPGCISGSVLYPRPARQHLSSKASCRFHFVHIGHHDQEPWYCQWLASHQQIATPRGEPREAGGEGMSSGARDPGASRRKRRELRPGVPSMQASMCTVTHAPCARRRTSFVRSWQKCRNHTGAEGGTAADWMEKLEKLQDSQGCRSCYTCPAHAAYM